MPDPHAPTASTDRDLGPGPQRCSRADGGLADGSELPARESVAVAGRCVRPDIPFASGATESKVAASL